MSHVYPYPNSYADVVACIQHVATAIMNKEQWAVKEWHHHLWTIQGFAAGQILGNSDDVTPVIKSSFAAVPVSNDDLAAMLMKEVSVKGDNAINWQLILTIVFELLMKFVIQR